MGRTVVLDLHYGHCVSVNRFSLSDKLELCRSDIIFVVLLCPGDWFCFFPENSKYLLSTRNRVITCYRSSNEDNTSHASQATSAILL